MLEDFINFQKKEVGFEPTIVKLTDLQSAAFNPSAIPSEFGGGF